ncbi:MAG: M28 family peptidase, partial [Planctomycetota bacterium]
VSVEIDRQSSEPPNVGAVLPGAGALAREYVVIGAHFDGLGEAIDGRTRGGQAAVGELHPGADDNASGTAGLLVAAERLAAYRASLPPTADVRSMLFLGFNVEEIGLLGSAHYVANPIAPIGAHTAMLNLDMIGRLRDNTVEIGGLETAQGLQELAAEPIERSGLEMKPIDAGLFGRSDHASFIAERVPAVFFFTGLHDDYHTPADTADKVNIEGAIRVTNLAADLAEVLITTGEPLRFRRTSPSGRPITDPAQMRERRTTREPALIGLGVRPTRDDSGVAVTQIFDGGSAANSDLQPGDVIVRWNNAEIRSIEDLSRMMAAARAGRTAKLLITREGDEMSIEMPLRAAD